MTEGRLESRGEGNGRVGKRLDPLDFWTRIRPHDGLLQRDVDIVINTDHRHSQNDDEVTWFVTSQLPPRSHRWYIEAAFFYSQV